MEKEFDILTGAKRLDEVRFSKIRTVMDMVADLRAKGEKVLALSAGEPDFMAPTEAIRLLENFCQRNWKKRQGFPMIRRQRSFSPPAVQKP